MKLFFGSALFLLSALGDPGLAQDSTDVAHAKKGQDPNKMICHTEQATGSLLATTRECHTAAQWRDIHQQQRADIDRARSTQGH